MPEIVNAITQRNYELVRDRIANILAIELPSQATLNSDVDLNPTIEIERFVPVKDTELPLVNIMLLRGDYDSYTSIQQDGTYMYHIDVYTKSKWTADDRADKLAFMKLQRLTGVIQAILSDSKYRTLGWAQPSVSRVQVNSIKFAEPSNSKDASTSVMARLEFEVRIPETVEIATLNLIAGYDTSVIMGNTAQGYVFSGNSAPIPPFVCAPVNVYNTDKSLDINILSGDFFEIPNSGITIGGNIFSLPATINLNVPIVDSNGDAVVNNLVAGEIEIPLLPAAPGTVNVNQSDGSLIEAVTVASGGTENFNVPFWIRNPDWLTLPVINVGDERFVGLYAVFENDVDDNTITIDIDVAGNDIDYGDGTTVTSVNGTNTHTYTYATVTGAVVQTPQGSNYKMVIVDVDLTGVTDMLLDIAVGAHSFRSTGWLDISAASPTLNRIDLAGDAVPFLLERFVVEEMNLNSTYRAQPVRGCNMLKIYDYPLLNSSYSANGLFEDAAQGGIRDKNNNPIEINNPMGADFRVFCRFSGVDKLGDINLPNALVDFMFYFSNISEIGNMYFDGVGATDRMFQNSRIRKVGTIQVSSALTNIFRMFFIVTLEEIIFTGDMSGVTNTLDAFDRNPALKRLLMPLISVGFDISGNSIAGAPLQDLFTSLGNANGAQTITLPNFTSGESTTIATNKGYTIAYA